MTLGNKIRKYRKLKDLTQKELGLKVGFSAETADSRIRKYESDSMAPKTAIRTKLAEALDIDISALSDINVSTYEDVMRVLFQFEDTFGMDIEKRDGSTYLYFNDDNVEIRTLITYMNIWKSQKKLLLSDSENNSEEQKRAYELWKSRFAGNTRDYFARIEKEILERYKPLIETVDRLYSAIGMTSDMSFLYERIRDAGLTVSKTYDSQGSESGLTFIGNELLSPPSKAAELLFGQFLVELGCLSTAGVANRTEMQMPGDSLLVTYFWKGEQSL